MTELSSATASVPVSSQNSSGILLSEPLNGSTSISQSSNQNGQMVSLPETGISTPASTDLPPRLDVLPKSAEGVRIFVGMIPGSVSEEELRNTFEMAGLLVALYMGWDKRNNTLKFSILTFSKQDEANKAIELFNGQKPFPSAESPLTVKFADNQPGNNEQSTFTLFVRKFALTTTREELEKVFSAFGRVSDVNIVRKPLDPNNPSGETSTGYALLKIDSRENGEAAIRALNHVHKVEGSPVSLEVRWGKEQTRLLQQTMPMQPFDFRKRKAEEDLAFSAFGSPFGFKRGPTQATAVFPGRPTAFTTPGRAGYFEAPPGSILIHQGGVLPGGGFVPPGSSVYLSPSADYSNSPAMAAYPGGVVGLESLVPGAQFGAADYYGAGAAAAGYGGWPTDPSGYALTAAAAAAGYGGQQPQVYDQSGGGAVYSHTLPQQQSKAYEPQQEGPPGANLFVSNIPPEFGDAELRTAFTPFGRVLSAKVFIDKNTGQSRNFGFVSFDTPGAAGSAIKVMDGFNYGTRQLKVQLKRGNK